MTSASGAEFFGRVAVFLYLAVFLTYLFVPLLYMVGAGFNASSFPTMTPWRGATLKWVVVAWQDGDLWRALATSLLIACAVILVAVPLGLAGALLLTFVGRRAGAVLYGLMVAPVLIPGIVIGLSTVIFWKSAAGVSGFWGLSVAGQSSFIAAYCMLICSARLQRLDPSLEAAALDLGASPRQVFLTVTLPFLRPALLSAAVLAFMQSLENFNTTLFTIGNDLTLPVYIAGKIKVGVTPAVNIVATVLILVTIAFGGAYEALRRRTLKTRG